MISRRGARGERSTVRELEARGAAPAAASSIAACSSSGERVRSKIGDAAEAIRSIG